MTALRALHNSSSSRSSSTMLLHDFSHTATTFWGCFACRKKIICFIPCTLNRIMCLQNMLAIHARALSCKSCKYANCQCLGCVPGCLDECLPSCCGTAISQISTHGTFMENMSEVRQGYWLTLYPTRSHPIPEHWCQML